MLRIVLAFMLFSNVVVANDNFYYDGTGLTTGDAYQQMLDHSCLAFIIFLEARGDGKLSQTYHGMATINRVLKENRWGNNVCEVVMQPSQYESIGKDERAILNRVLKGDVFACDDYIKTNWTKPIYHQLWRDITQLAYRLVSVQQRDDTWIEANHFYSPKSLSQRGMSTPMWIAEKTVVGVAGDTYFLK